ncbi:hypothetical protein chiPu_0008665 [Chiloscyllium punctatum]|uniref:Uncharacterized protein n=1 Tax=Chiloscyllium punctatum TaxID=137246 RepID=A0A401SII6_CHIPU|nr:hypothetical protein [Chiloscyllium punctatum]
MVVNLRTEAARGWATVSREMTTRKSGSERDKNRDQTGKPGSETDNNSVQRGKPGLNRKTAIREIKERF